MPGSNQQIGLNGFEVWAFVVELDEGFRMRLDIDDWRADGRMEGVELR